MTSPGSNSDVAAPTSELRSSSGPVRGPILLLVSFVAMAILLIAGTVLFGASSHASPSGSIDGAIVAASEAYRLAGVNVDALSFTAEKSLVDPHWAKFTADPVTASGLNASYGYELFAAHHWSVIASGTSFVGCTSSPPVPRRIITSFGLTCEP